MKKNELTNKFAEYRNNRKVKKEENARAERERKNRAACVKYFICYFFDKFEFFVCADFVVCSVFDVSFHSVSSFSLVNTVFGGVDFIIIALHKEPCFFRGRVKSTRGHVLKLRTWSPKTWLGLLVSCAFKYNLND